MSGLEKIKIMYKTRHGASLILALVVVLATVSAGYADLYWVTEQTSRGFPGQPDGKRTVKNYLTDRASRLESNDGVVIMDYDRMIMYQLNPMDKTYVSVTADQMLSAGPSTGGENMDPEMQKQMMEEMAKNTQVIPTSEEKTIAGYRCRKYLVKSPVMNSEYWLSKDVQGYRELRQLTASLEKKLRKNPMMQQMNVVGMMSKLDGFPVQSVVQSMGGVGTTTLQHIEVKPLPDSLFKVPKGYRPVSLQ